VVLYMTQISFGEKVRIKGTEVTGKVVGVSVSWSEEQQEEVVSSLRVRVGDQVIEVHPSSVETAAELALRKLCPQKKLLGDGHD